MSTHAFNAISLQRQNVIIMKVFHIALKNVEKNTKIIIQKINVQQFKNFKNQLKKFQKLIKVKVKIKMTKIFRI